jgi:hypothetical protein
MASTTIEEVISAIVENRRRFKDFCYALTPEQLNRPVPGSTWIVRDFAAHLDTLDTAMVPLFEGAATGASVDATLADGGTPFDVDEFNDAEVASRRSWPLERIFAEADANRERLIAALRTLTDEQVERRMHFGGDSKRPPGDLPFKLFLVGWAQHDPIHVADMIKALPELADDPELKRWLDNRFVAGYQAVMSAP